MRPLKITAILENPKVVSTDGYLPLDSMLAWAWIRKHYPDRIGTDSAKVDLIVPELPLQRVIQHGGWFWVCSFAYFKKLDERIEYWHKRFDADLACKYMGKKKGAVNVKSGRYKAYRMPIVVNITDKLEWFCVGDEAEVRKLLLGITGIGKKCSQGYGLVRDWRVEQIKEDYSIVGPEGQLMRSVYELPVVKRGIYALPEKVKAYRKAHYGLRPPYWLPANQAVVYMPLNAGCQI